MSFAVPLWLLAGVVACFGLLWSWRRYDARQQAALGQFVSAHLRVALTSSFSPARRRAKRGLLLGAVALIFIALAGPQSGYRWEQLTRRGNDIIFAVDTSRSMLTPDVKPNRLARAKLAIDDFVTHLNGDAVGLIAFAGTAFLQTPLTLDYGAFHESLSALDTHIIPRGGTNIASAIQEAQTALRQRPGSDKILVLVTDGEDLEGNALTAAKNAASQDGLKIYTVGVGSANGDLIPLPSDQGGGYVEDAAGNPVKSRLDESGLKAIAEATGGVYAPLGAEGQGLQMIYQQAVAPLVKHDLASRQQRIPMQRYQWPLAAGLGLLLASALMGIRRRPASKRDAVQRQPIGAEAVVPGIAALSALMLLMPIHSAHASAATAAKAYAQGDFITAQRDFAAAAQGNPKEPALRYDAGTAAYRAGQFPDAAAAFQASLSAKPSADARRVAEQENTYYDLGNALYRAGQKTEQSSAEQTIQTWTQSVKAYEAAIQLNVNDADSKFNRDLVLHKLEQLKQQQKQQQKQSQQEQQNKPNQANAKTPQNQQQQQQQQEKSAGNQAPKQQGKEQNKDQKNGQSQSTQVAQGDKPQPSPPSGGGASPPDRPSQSGQQAPPRTAGTGQSPDQHASTGADQRQDETASDNQAPPGQMSREEARELLDSVKDEEHRFPVAPLARNGSNSNAADEPRRDW